MSHAVLDTSVLIANDVQPLPGELAISVISLAELLDGVLVAKSADARATRLARLTGLQKRFTARGPRWRRCRVGCRWRTNLR